jgi:hypothetical protein
MTQPEKMYELTRMESGHLLLVATAHSDITHRMCHMRDKTIEHIQRLESEGFEPFGPIARAVSLEIKQGKLCFSANTRYELRVEVNRDGVPGLFNNPEDWVRCIQEMLNGTVGHYNPIVEYVATH